MIRNIFNSLLLAAFIMLTLSSCEFIGDVLEFGFWAGVIFATLVMSLLGWLYRKFRK